jgi:peptidyl-prolyl cis-trans isomerase SurA
VYECLNKDIANEVYGMLKSSDTISSKTIIEKVNKSSELNLKVRTNKFEVEQTPFLKGRQLSMGVNAPYEHDGKVYVVKVNEILKPGPKVLSEAKGAATSDYQNYLEKEWLEELAKKHPITVNTAVLYSLEAKKGK